MPGGVAGVQPRMAAPYADWWHRKLQTAKMRNLMFSCQHLLHQINSNEVSGHRDGSAFYEIFTLSD
jgi:hypothetical protein